LFSFSCKVYYNTSNMRTLLSFAIALCCFYSKAQQQTTLLFEFGTTTLTEDSKQKLASLMQQLKQKPPASITIDGHTDKAGKETFNRTLSANRAEFIERALKAELPETIQLTTNSHASANLLSNKDEEQHLNRRVEIIVYYNTGEPTTTTSEEKFLELQPYKKDVAEQRFNVNLDDTVEITAKEGTYLKIPPGSIQNKQGKIATGWAELIIKEYYKPSDIVLAGLHSMSKDGLLQSGGMVNMIIIQDGDTMQTKTKKKILLQMPQVEKSLTGMQVYEMPHNETSGPWRNVNMPLVIIGNYWKKPVLPMHPTFKHKSDEYYTSLPIGRGSSDEYIVEAPFITFKKHKRPFAKKVSYQMVKKDEKTLEINVKLKMRNRGVRKFRKRNIDTTFSIKYHTAYYSALINSMGSINADKPFRLREDIYENNNNIQFTINTPGFKGMRVMCYYKSLRAFMPANGSEGQYNITQSPPNAEVIVLAFGKKGDEFYFGKQEFITGKNKSASVILKKSPEADFEKEIKNL
jgi:hypothetical protein